MEFLHPFNTNFIQWFQDIHGSKQECSTTTSWVKNSNILQCLVEMKNKQMVVSLTQQIINKRTDVQIVSNEIIDMGNLSIPYLIQYGFTALQTFYRFTPNFSR